MALLGSAISASADCVDDLVAKYGRQNASEVLKTRQAELRQCFMQATSPAPAPKRRAGQRVASAPPAFAAALPVKAPGIKAPDIPPEYITNIYPLLRRNFTDVWLFDERKGVSDVPDAEGALFSVSGDRVAHNTVWTAHAMGAVVYQVLHDRYQKGSEFNFIGLSLAPFVQIDRVRNSNPKAQVNNVDQFTFGGSGEIGFDALGGAQYFRARGAGMTDHIAGTSSGSAVLEWIPVYDGILNSPFGFNNIPVTFVFGPEVDVRYDNVVINDATGQKDYLVRAGAQVFLSYGVVADALPDSLKGLAFLASLHGKTTFNWLTDTDSSRRFSNFATSLTYNLDPDGHLGLTGSYTKGRLVDSGRQVDLWQLGLTGKF